MSSNFFGEFDHSLKTHCKHFLRVRSSYLEEVRVLLPWLCGQHGPLLLPVVLVDVLARRHLHQVVGQLPGGPGDLGLRPRGGGLLGTGAARHIEGDWTFDHTFNFKSSIL